MSWPPSDERWNQILEDLAVDSRAAVRAAVDAAVREYLAVVDCGDDRPSAAQSDLWKALARQAAGKAMKSFYDNIAKLQAHPPDPEAEWLLRLAAELAKVAAKAKARAVVYQPRDRKVRLYAALMRAWTEAGMNLGQSEEGPLARFLCAIAEDVPFKLSESGAKKAIGREKDRRSALTVLGEKWAGQGILLIDETKVYLVDQFGNRKP